MYNYLKSSKIGVVYKSLQQNSEKIGFWLSILAFVFYCTCSIDKMFITDRIPWEDESHFWTMIQHCSVPELIALMKVEGHFMLWYLVVMPFAKLGFPYPYTMQVINWLFCTGALYVVWKKAPFNYYIKALIIICPVFVNLYSVAARCYSIGALFLFLACALYQERLKKPYLFFLMLLLAVNTSFQGVVAATALGAVFVYDLFRNKSYKELMVVFAIALLNGILFYFQFFNFQVPDFETDARRFNALVDILGWGRDQFEGWIVELRIFMVVTALVMIRRLRVLFVFLFIFSLSTALFVSLYAPRPWHLSFYVVYVILVYWIFLLENPSKRIKNVTAIILFIFFACLVPNKIGALRGDYFLKNTFEQHEELKRAKLFTNIPPITMSIMLPYLNKEGVYFYDLNGRNLSEFDSLITYFDQKAKRYNPQNLNKHLDSKRMNIFITFGMQDAAIYRPARLLLYFQDQNIYVYEVLKN